MHEELGFVAEAQDAPDEYETVGVEELQPQEDMVADDTGLSPVAQYRKAPPWFPSLRGVVATV